jgi:hypothetical protein
MEHNLSMAHFCSDNELFPHFTGILLMGSGLLGYDYCVTGGVVPNGLKDDSALIFRGQAVLQQLPYFVVMP